MSKNVAVFVDVANIYYSARGQEVDVDYVALLKAATKGRDLIRAYAYSGLDPENENQRKFIDFLGKNGYKVVHKDIRKFGDGRMKANLDIELVVDLFRLANRMDIAVIVSGDGDFAPAIRALQDVGVRCEVISFRPNTSSDLLAVADEFLDMMKIIGIGRGKDAEKTDKVMSAPPMPAKEVTPEFGFREAPAAVAAAALAALREGKEGRPAPRRRGRSAAVSVVPTEQPTDADAPVAVDAAAPAEGGVDPVTGEARRRRRRRGGRGRGRGRGREDAARTEPTAAPGEIGWIEVDDISEIAALDEMAEPREYTFEEADPATLAELGLLPEPTPVAAARPRRPRSPKADAPVAGEDAAPADKPRRSRPAKLAAVPVAEEAAPQSPDAEAKPARSRRPRAAGSASLPTEHAASDVKARRAPRTAASRPPESGATGETAADGTPDGEQEGIWQRFRSARTTKG